jgi:hypothetical protein
VTQHLDDMQPVTDSRTLVDGDEPTWVGPALYADRRAAEWAVRRAIHAAEVATDPNYALSTMECWHDEGDAA